MAQRRERVAKKEGYHHGDLKRALLDAALALIEAEKGTQELSLREVARHSGVTHAAPYRHFADKEALLAAVAEEGFRLMRARMVARMAPARDALHGLTFAGLAYVEFAAAHRAHFRVMFGGQIPDFEKHPALLETSAAAFSLLVESVAAAQQQGLVRGQDPMPSAMAAWSSVHGLANLLIAGQLQHIGVDLSDVSRVAEEQLEKLVHGLAIPKPASAGRSRKG